MKKITEDELKAENNRLLESLQHFNRENAELVEALRNLVGDWERVHGPIPADHEARAALAKADA